LRFCDVDGDALDVEEALEWGPDDPDLVCIAQRSILTEISVTSVPADPACCVRALRFNAECWRMTKQGEAELQRILHSDGDGVYGKFGARRLSPHRDAAACGFRRG
jgi:hypothetical protein